VADVTFIAGTTATFNSGSLTIAQSTPAGISDNDTILAFVYGRGTLATLSGWTLLATTSNFNTDSSSYEQRIAVYSKTTVTSADSSTSFTWTQSGGSNPFGQRMGLFYQVFQNVDTITTPVTTANSDVDTFVVTPTGVTSAANGTAFAGAGSCCLVSGSTTPTVPSSFTKSTGTSATDYRMVGAYRTSVNSGTTSSGTFDLAPGAGAPSGTFGQTNGTGSIMMRLNPASLPTLSHYVEAASPLGAFNAVATVPSGIRGQFVGPLGEFNSTVATDFHDLIEGQTVYSVMDLTLDDDSIVRIPISSWNATIQTDERCYLRCSMPAGELTDDEFDAITEAVSFTITMQTTTSRGEPIERSFTCTPTDPDTLLVQIDEGATNYTMQVYGYSDAYPTIDTPAEGFYRPMRGKSSLSTSPDRFRARCSVDWIMIPGDVATDGATEFTVAYMNVYATDDGNTYMDIGSRPPVI